MDTMIGHVTAKNGETYRYLYKYSWRVKYYSFDGEQTWHKSRETAYQTAKASGLLCKTNEHYVRDGAILAVVSNAR